MRSEFGCSSTGDKGHPENITSTHSKMSKKPEIIQNYQHVLWTKTVPPRSLFLGTQQQGRNNNQRE